MRRGGWVLLVLVFVALPVGCASIIGVGDDVVVTPSDAGGDGEAGSD